MKMKDKIQTAICNLEAEVEVMETEIRTIIADRLNTNYPKVRQLCEGINIACNEIGTLKGLY